MAVGKSHDGLPLARRIEPSEAAEVAEAVRAGFAASEAVYPIGGATSLDYGLPVKRPGVGLCLGRLNRIVDYPARDLTVTVESGVTMAALAVALAQENQELPLDVPFPDQATVGGVVAANWNGPRRDACGAVRDQVIGIEAVDGRGVRFKGGGRVVKNVAGYDFCKLLTGSLGTLAVVTQVTFKLRPRSRRFALSLLPVADLAQAERLLERMTRSETRPAAIELVGGPAWSDDPEAGGAIRAATRGASTDESSGLAAIVAWEGTEAEVDWMLDRFALELHEIGLSDARTLGDAEAARLWRRLIDFSATGDSPLTLKASVVPSGTTGWIEALRAVDGRASWQAHAGVGVVIARLSQFPAEGLSRTLLARLQPAAAAAHGKVVILSNPGGVEATRQSWWGGVEGPYAAMVEVKRQFDPKNLLNPGRFVFPLELEQGRP